MMLHYLKTFRSKEDGAVTVDWVVLTAIIVVLGITVVTVIGQGTYSLGEKISSQLEAQTIATY